MTLKRLFRNAWTSINAFCRKYVSPVFLLLLGVSFVLWYITKLSYTYTTEIPVSVNVDGYKFKVQCRVEGVGSRLFAHHFYISDRTKLSFSELEITHSEQNPYIVSISPESLLNAIAIKHPDIRFISIGPIPELDLSQQQEE